MDRRQALAELLEERRARKGQESNITIGFSSVGLENGRPVTCQHIHQQDGEWVDVGDRHDYNLCPHENHESGSAGNPKARNILVRFWGEV